MNAHQRGQSDQAAPASEQAMSQTEAKTEATQAPTVADLWHRRALILGQSFQIENDDNSELDKEQTEIEWAMVRTPSTLHYEVAHKLEVVRYWYDIGRPADRIDELLLESAICDLRFESLK